MTDDTEPKGISNPWREFIENVIAGKNYFRAGEYRDLLADLDRLYALENEHAKYHANTPETPLAFDAGKTKLAITMLERFRDGRLMTAQGTHESLLGPRDQLLEEADWFDYAAKVLKRSQEECCDTVRERIYALPARIRKHWKAVWSHLYG